jgi:hypothetical protein
VVFSTERPSLQGDLDDFPLTDVVRLLAARARTGQLVVDTPAGAGALWLGEGGLLAAAPPAQGTVEPAPPSDEVVFELGRHEGSRFAFARDVASPLGTGPFDVEPVLAGAEGLLVGWRDTLTVVPSLRCRVVLRTDLSGDDAVIGASQWRLVVAIAGGTTVGELGAVVGLGEVAVSRAVAGLVRDGFGEVLEPTPAVAASLPVVRRPADRAGWSGDHVAEVVASVATRPGAASVPAAADDHGGDALDAAPWGGGSPDQGVEPGATNGHARNPDGSVAEPEVPVAHLDVPATDPAVDVADQDVHVVVPAEGAPRSTVDDGDRPAVAASLAVALDELAVLPAEALDGGDAGEIDGDGDLGQPVAPTPATGVGDDPGQPVAPAPATEVSDDVGRPAVAAPAEPAEPDQGGLDPTLPRVDRSSLLKLLSSVRA